MNQSACLSSERLLLKPLSMEHLSERYVAWLNDPDVYRYLETGGNYDLNQLRNYLEDVEQRVILFWAIHLKKNDKHIGNIKIDPINDEYGLGEYGIMLGDRSEWGKGYAQEASEAVIDYCFHQRPQKLRKITLGVIADNTAALHLYKKMGFIEEGILKYHTFHDNKYCHTIRMAIFNPEFTLE